MSGALHHGTDLSGTNSPLSYPTLYVFQGSGFIAYAIIMSIMLLVGEGWVRRKGRSPEFYDSLVITIWVWPFSIDYLLLHAKRFGIGHRYAEFGNSSSLTQGLLLSEHIHGAQRKHLVG